MKYIRTFEQLKKDDILIAGGKGANLGELVDMGMPVPTGFVIITSSYEKFVAENGLHEIILRELTRSKDESAIREAFLKASISRDMEQEISSAFRKLQSKKVAVRSSATAEDLPGAAFAGQQDTYLNIKEAELFEAVKNVWASLWTERAIAYRERLGIEQSSVKIAVVVQTMVGAEFSGVLFTVNPVTGNRDEMVIDAASGLGEKLVSGEITPNHFILRRGILRWNIIERNVTLNGSIFPEAVLQKLSALGLEIQKHFKTSQDIEWAYKKDKIYILQSRPITALPNKSLPKNKIVKLVSGIVAEMMPTRPYPLESSTFGPKFIVYTFLRPAVRKFGFKAPSLEELFIEENGVLVRFTGALKIRPSSRVFLAPFIFFWFVVRYNSSQWKSDKVLHTVLDDINHLESKPYDNLSATESLLNIKSALAIAPKIFDVRIRYIPRIALSILWVRMFLVLTGNTDKLALLLYSGITTKVTETNNALDRLADKIRSNQHLIGVFKETTAEHIGKELEKTESGRSFLQDFNGFLDVYGYRETAGTLRISEPNWKEVPESVFEMLKGVVVSKKPAIERKIGHSVFQEVINTGLLRLMPFRQLFLKFLKTARELHVIREDTRFYLMMLMPTLRRSIGVIGEWLRQEKVIQKSEDIFYLTLDEVDDMVANSHDIRNKTENVQVLINKRKKRYSDLKNTPVVDPDLYRVAEAMDDAIVMGTPGSHGVAEGKARIIKDTSEFSDLEQGEVLIAPYTNPSWTPLFERAAAVVVDTGSVMSHAAIVAREYGIPAVMGTVDGTAKIKNGMIIRVDGSAGAVFVAKS